MPGQADQRPLDEVSDWWIRVRLLPHDVPVAVRLRRFVRRH
jgi:hypothetical protein